MDLGAAAYGTIEVLAVVLDRKRSGKGKLIEIPPVDMSVYWNGYWITYYGMTGKIPQKLESNHLGYSPHRVFRAKDDKYFLIVALNDSEWKKLSETLGLSLGPEFAKMGYRLSPPCRDRKCSPRHHCKTQFRRGSGKAEKCCSLCSRTTHRRSIPRWMTNSAKQGCYAIRFIENPVQNTPCEQRHHL